MQSWDFMRSDLFIFRFGGESSSSRCYFFIIPRIPCALNPLLSHLLEPALNFNGFFLFSDANDYFASYPLKLMAYEGALRKASLSCHSLGRHVNCTYRLLGGVTHRHHRNLISDIFSPRPEHIYTRRWLKLQPQIGYSGAHLRVIVLRLPFPNNTGHFLSQILDWIKGICPKKLHPWEKGCCHTDSPWTLAWITYWFLEYETFRTTSRWLCCR